MGSIKDKAVIVMGAGGKDNMGQVIARRFAREGAKVVVTGRQEEPIRQFAAEIGADWRLCDITHRDEVFAVAEYVRQTYGKVDVGVNATGWGLLRPFEETSEADLDKIIGIQFKGPFFFFQAMLGVMGAGGSIIQISSATATIMLENHAAYMGTKAGTDHILRTVANEFGGRGIRANSISPGMTKTPMAGGTFEIPAFVNAFQKEYPLGRIGTSEDIAAAAVWLADDECFMTGQNLQVNGGLTLRRNPTFAEIGPIVAEATAHLT
jgi:NAD(P)-dependent dehydrogenase (short-subunit alcohol dehydrogenase family)